MLIIVALLHKMTSGFRNTTISLLLVTRYCVTHLRRAAARGACKAVQIDPAMFDLLMPFLRKFVSHTGKWPSEAYENTQFTIQNPYKAPKVPSMISNNY